jgi:WD40 repeat protein
MRIVSAGNDKTVHVWDAATGNNLSLFQDETDAVRIVAWSSDGTRIATVGTDAVARVWDVTTNRLITSYPGHRGQTVIAMTWSPTQQRLASAGNDGTIHVWDATSGQPIIVYKGHAASVNAVAWSFNGYGKALFLDKSGFVNSIRH